MKVIGIDPGQSGAICSLDVNPQSNQILTIQLESMPVNGTEIDFHRLSDIFRNLAEGKGTSAILEKVSAMPGQGVSSMFKFGRNVGALQALLAAFKIPYTEVTPQAWQKVMHEGASRQSLPDPKKRSLAVVKKLFPTVNLLKTERSKVPDMGFVDALLIAEYARRREGYK